MRKKKQSKQKQVPSIIKAQNSKQYIDLLKSADKTITSYTNTVSKMLNKTKDEIEAEIQYIYLENLRKADDPVALMKENLVGLMLKKQTTDYLREQLFNQKLKEAELLGDNEQIQKIKNEMFDNLLIDDFDIRLHNTIMSTIKTINNTNTKKMHTTTQELDDRMHLDSFDGVYDFLEDKK